MFSDKDLEYIASHGLTAETAARQMRNFETGFPYLEINRPATAGDGIIRLGKEDAAGYSALYDSLAKGKTIVKFVPASGAATRMFKELFEYVNEGKTTNNATEVAEKIDRLAFGGEIRRITENSADPKIIVSAIINKEGLDYGHAPKGLILFHKYSDGPRTAVEEHLVEGTFYAGSNAGRVNIHLTISPEHRAGFEKLISAVLPAYEAKYGVKYDISYSEQKPSTYTLAATSDNRPFREDDGTLVLRPAGHGALLENLAEIDADVIFIKTIDNVAPDRLKEDTVKYKKALGGIMLSLQKRIFYYLGQLYGEASEKDLHNEIISFIENELCYRIPMAYRKMADPVGQREFLYNILDRPLRVCGMVRNEGEPGGGPFWVGAPDGSESLQIAESSQIAPEEKYLMSEATHFNPVDLVCGTKNFRGEKFDLAEYVDDRTGFISVKSKNGRELKAQELPGLWNGSMAEWNTVFVEVPISTFSPVKTVNDLLREQHR